MAVALTALTARWASAQGNGHGHGPPVGHGQGTSPKPPTVDAAAGIGPTGNAEFPVRNFGSWVDDAYVLPRGEAWVSIGAGYWRLPYANQLDVPILSSSIGVAQRVHLSATVPFANIRYPDGYTVQRVGDIYVSAKVGVRPASQGVGIAVSPVLEVLSDGSWPTPDGGTIGRLHWALPVNLEYRGEGWRTYGSAGYFSRGAVFGSGTIDVSLGTRAGVLGLLSHTYSTHDPVVPPEVEVGRSRTDVSGGLYVLPRPTISCWALAGRTISQIDDYASSFFITGGISFKVAQPKAAP
jgi:hypothetical protein